MRIVYNHSTFIRKVSRFVDYGRKIEQGYYMVLSKDKDRKCLILSTDSEVFWITANGLDTSFFNVKMEEAVNFTKKLETNLIKIHKEIK